MIMSWTTWPRISGRFLEWIGWIQNNLAFKINDYQERLI
jgi:hypothetical protein